MRVVQRPSSAACVSLSRFPVFLASLELHKCLAYSVDGTVKLDHNVHFLLVTVQSRYPQSHLPPAAARHRSGRASWTLGPHHDSSEAPREAPVVERWVKGTKFYTRQDTSAISPIGSAYRTRYRGLLSDITLWLLLPLSKTCFVFRSISPFGLFCPSLEHDALVLSCYRAFWRCLDRS